MPAQDPFKRYLEAGLEYTEITRKRAESIVKEWVKAGDVQREHAQQRVEELIERSRQASEAFAGAVRTEVTRQLQELGLVQAPGKTARNDASSSGENAGPAKAARKATGATKATAAKSATGAKKAAKATATKATNAAKKTTGRP